MSWEGKARSNYVRIRDMDGLNAYLGNFCDFDIHSDGKGRHCLVPLTEQGDWPVGMCFDNEGVEEDFAFERIVEFLDPDQIFIIMEAGHDKARIITGFAKAMHTTSKDSVQVSLSDIYDLASEHFKAKDISPAEY